jgi:hypothetical protein
MLTAGSENQDEDHKHRARGREQLARGVARVWRTRSRVQFRVERLPQPSNGGGFGPTLPTGRDDARGKRSWLVPIRLAGEPLVAPSLAPPRSGLVGRPISRWVLAGCSATAPAVLSRRLAVHRSRIAARRPDQRGDLASALQTRDGLGLRVDRLETACWVLASVPNQAHRRGSNDRWPVL